MLCAVPVAAAEILPPAAQAILLEGPSPVEGLPGFGPNRIPALFARYVTADGKRISVYAVSEPLVFNPSAWTERKLERSQYFLAPGGEKSRLAAFPRTFTMQASLADRRRWFFILSFPDSFSDESCLSFSLPFLERTAAIFQAARRTGDLCFPALVNTEKKR